MVEPSGNGGNGRDSGDGGQPHYAVIGHPVAHSLSPEIHTHFATRTGESLRYVAIDVGAGDFESFWREGQGRRLAGANITLPHKRAALRLADEVTARASRAGAVNTLKRLPDGALLGDNTDGVGLVRDLTDNLGWPVTDRDILVLGAGGAARGAIAALLDCHPARVTVANRTVERATAIAADFQRVEACGYDELRAAADGIVHATSMGHQGRRPPIPDAAVAEETWCYDMSYGRVAAPFLAWTRAHGARRTTDGIGMLVEQAAESFFLWRGVRPETAELIDQLRRSHPADS